MAKKILVVDDDVDFVFQQKLQLEAAGYDVITAGSAAEALETAVAESPDAALVDLMMEEADAGFQLCFQLKKKLPGLPVVMVTAVTSETGLEFDASTEEEQSWIKADAVLAKPVRIEQLQRELGRLLKG